MPSDVRVLLLADSHLGFDLPLRPRTGRRRRGYDFLANYAMALEPAMAGEVDIVVHAGDVFDRPTVVPTIAHQAYEPLRRVAERGVPVFIVPGNHERSRLPHARFAMHPGIRVFDGPRTFSVNVRGTTVTLSGFPYERRDVRTRFTELVDQTAWRGTSAEHRLLCIHHCVEGATVGPADFVFTTASDVIRLHDLPPEFAAVFSGHIHRHQVLIRDLEHRALRTPVLYPGSIERTSVAEVDEPKGFMVVRLSDAGIQWEFRRLPARPMIRRELSADRLSAEELSTAVMSIVDSVPADAVVSIRVSGALTAAQWRVLSPVRMRAFVPETMNVEISPVEGFGRRSAGKQEQVLRPLRGLQDDTGGAQLSFY